MGTFVSVEAWAESPRAALAAIEAAYSAVAAVEAHMHPERAGSDLARVNSAPPGTRTGIGQSTWQVLSLAQRLHALTAGVFDPCLPERPGCLGDLELAPQAPDGAPPDSPWVMCHAPLSVDLGGIAKGHAIDRAIEALIAGGCGAGLVNAGGDLRLFGARRERILLRRPDGAYLPLLLANTALAVSDADNARRPPAHRGYYNRTSGARAARRYAAVQAPTAMSADALTKCVLLCDAATAQSALRALAARCVP